MELGSGKVEVSLKSLTERNFCYKLTTTGCFESVMLLGKTEK